MSATTPSRNVQQKAPASARSCDIALEPDQCSGWRMKITPNCVIAQPDDRRFGDELVSSVSVVANALRLGRKRHG
ncbi:hypothetical protein RLIN73S_04658 [Rhodanobacter lindaniclasticus]